MRRPHGTENTSHALIQTGFGGGNDSEAGLSQSVAQMVAAHLFNQWAGSEKTIVFGCVTTGEAWQFLRLDGDTVTIDRGRYYINTVGLILAALRAVLVQSGVTA